MNDLKVFKSIKEFQSYRNTLPKDSIVGFVPTMGALHSGHEELLKRSVLENDITVLSIYVNPTQFNDPNDFKKYPITWDADLLLAKNNGVGIVLAPSYEEIYSDHYRYKVIENEFSKQLCGEHRPGHFDGVLTIVMKLLNIVNPSKAYFGEKDFQQLSLIRDMVSAFFMSAVIVSVPTTRENSGLAKSSRNARLSEEGKTKAALIYGVITTAESADKARRQLTELGFEVDYVVDRQGRRFAAAFLEGIRLIDNVVL